MDNEFELTFASILFSYQKKKANSTTPPPSDYENRTKRLEARGKMRDKCKRGHKLTLDTVYIYKDGYANCVECRKINRKDRLNRLRKLV